jgi:hypothetical protein
MDIQLQKREKYDKLRRTFLGKVEQQNWTLGTKKYFARG